MTDRAVVAQQFWSLSGVKRTPRDHRKSVAPDPERHFAAINCRIAKGLFDFDARWRPSRSGSFLKRLVDVADDRLGTFRRRILSERC
jgi:hypothetical protein